MSVERDLHNNPGLLAEAERVELTPEWTEPEPLPQALPPVAPYRPALLPDCLRARVDDIAERLQVPPDLVAAALVVAIAAAVGSRARIQPKKKDSSWQVVPNLWGAIVARPGAMKSPILNDVAKPLRRAEAAWIEDYEQERKGYAADRALFEARMNRWKAKVKKDDESEPIPEEPVEPICKRVLMNDSTPEKLHEILSGNSAGMVVYLDELTGLLVKLDREDNAGERQFYLACWNGDQPFTVDRIKRGTITVPNACLSLFGGIQPGRLQPYVAGALAGGVSDDGLLQRLQVTVYPDEPQKQWRNIDREPDFAAQQRVEAVFDKLLALDAGEPVRLRFSPDGQKLFDVWRSELEQELRSGDIPEYLASHLAKYRSLMPTLAGLFQLVEWSDGDADQTVISLDSAKRAAAFCDYLRSHAERIYGAAPQAAVRAAKTVLSKIRSAKLGPEQFTLREVYRPSWSGLRDQKQAMAACNTLVEYGWLWGCQSGTERGGTPTWTYTVNPLGRLNDGQHAQ